jgi:hypothetical protein
MPTYDVEYPERFMNVGGRQHTVVGATLASAATIAPTHGFHIVSGTTEITTITIPYEGFAGCIWLIPSGAWTFATGGNIAKAITAVENAPVCVVYNQQTALWYPMVP